MHNLITFERMNVVARDADEKRTAFEIPNSNYMVGNWNHALLNVQYTIYIMVKNLILRNFNGEHGHTAKLRERKNDCTEIKMQIEQGNTW